MNNKAKPYEIFNNKFCKVVIRTDSGDKALKGIISICDDNILISGDFQKTMINVSEIVRITKKQNDD